MTQLTLPLALFNLLPVIFTGLAMLFLARLVASVDPTNRVLAWLGGGLVVLAGASKATWKLILVTTELDLVWLASALFPLMAPGFALLAAAMLGVLIRLKVWGGTAWLGPGVALVILLVMALVVLRTWGLDIQRGWFLPLLGLASFANLLLSLALIASALRLGRKGAAALVVVNLGMTLVLPPIAMASPESLALHWLEQILTALGTAALALAAWRLASAARLSGH